MRLSLNGQRILTAFSRRNPMRRRKFETSQRKAIVARLALASKSQVSNCPAGGTYCVNGVGVRRPLRVRAVILSLAYRY